MYFALRRRRSHLAPGNEQLLHGYAPPLPPDPLVHEGPDHGPLTTGHALRHRNGADFRAGFLFAAPSRLVGA